MRLIDVDALMNILQKLFDKREKEQVFTGSRGPCVTWNDAIYHIKSAPTVDAVPVVFCKKCKHWDREMALIGHPENERYCPMIDLITDAGFFCKYGERKGGDE